MTTKEIAKAVGKDVSSVQRWVKRMNGKMQSIDGKMQYSNSTNPADFDLTETISIIENGMGKNAANLYRMNAIKQPLQNDKLPIQNADVVTKSDLAVFGTAIVSEMMKQFLPLIQNRQPLMIEQDYFSINGYANKIGQRIAFSDALAIGRMAGKLSREKGTEIRKVDDERYGTVNSYHVDILKEVFSV